MINFLIILSFYVSQIYYEFLAAFAQGAKAASFHAKELARQPSRLFHVNNRMSP